MSSTKLKIKKRFESLKPPYAGNIKGIWKLIRKKEKSAFQKIAQNLKPGSHVLDLGAGSCEYAKILIEYGAKRVDCVDFASSLMVGGFHDLRLKKIIADVDNFDTAETYHLILCAGLLEFLDQPESLPFRLKKNLKQGGKWLVLLPLSPIRALIYTLYYRSLGIRIHPLSLKSADPFFIKAGFQAKTTLTENLFSAWVSYIAKD